MKLQQSRDRQTCRRQLPGRARVWPIQRATRKPDVFIRDGQQGTTDPPVRKAQVQRLPMLTDRNDSTALQTRHPQPRPEGACWRSRRPIGRWRTRSPTNGDTGRLEHGPASFIPNLPPSTRQHHRTPFPAETGAFPQRLAKPSRRLPRALASPSPPHPDGAGLHRPRAQRFRYRYDMPQIPAPETPSHTARTFPADQPTLQPRPSGGPPWSAAAACPN